MTSRKTCFVLSCGYTAEVREACRAWTEREFQLAAAARRALDQKIFDDILSNDLVLGFHSFCLVVQSDPVRLGYLVISDSPELRLATEVEIIIFAVDFDGDGDDPNGGPPRGRGPNLESRVYDLSVCWCRQPNGVLTYKVIFGTPGTTPVGPMNNGDDIPIETAGDFGSGFPVSFSNSFVRRVRSRMPICEGPVVVASGNKRSWAEEIEYSREAADFLGRLLVDGRRGDVFSPDDAGVDISSGWPSIFDNSFAKFIGNKRVNRPSASQRNLMTDLVALRAGEDQFHACRSLNETTPFTSCVRGSTAATYSRFDRFHRAETTGLSGPCDVLVERFRLCEVNVLPAGVAAHCVKRELPGPVTRRGP